MMILDSPVPFYVFLNTYAKKSLRDVNNTPGSQLQWCAYQNQQTLFYEVNSSIWPHLVENENTITLLPFRLQFSIDCTFKMGYCMNSYLNWQMNYEWSKMELSNLLNKNINSILTFRSSFAS